MLYALIMAGGSGTRLWPLSRRHMPKQALPLTNAQRSMFRITAERLQPLIPPERVYVVTSAETAAIFQTQVPALPPANYIIEPSAKDSGPAAALGLAHICRHDPHATVAILTADHYIADEPAFRNALRAAESVAAQEYIVTLGIRPTFPATGFGYIARAESLATAHGLDVYRAARFVEKPSQEVAESYLASGAYFWNSGMFITTCALALAEFDRQQPQFAQALRALMPTIGTSDYPTALQQAWNVAPKRSLDYAIMEGAQRVAVIPVEIGWSDIGSWAALWEVLPKDAEGNVVMGDVVALDAQRAFIRAEGGRVVTVLGAHDVVIVDTPDALLVCSMQQAAELKRLVDLLRAHGRDAVL